MKADEHLFLIKFLKPEYVENFINKGEIHFESLKYFIDLEENDGDSVIGDALEGMVESHVSPKNGYVFAFRKVGDNNPPTIVSDIDAILRVKVPEHIKKTIGVACFSWLDTSDLIIDKKSGDSILTDTAIRRLKSFNTDHRIPVVITNPVALMKKIQSKKGANDDVVYYDENDVDGAMTLANEKSNISKIIFRKRMKYIDQKEHRFIVKLEDTDKNRNIYVGDISNICVKLDI